MERVSPYTDLRSDTGFLVKNTEAPASRALPYTICINVTAVPQCSDTPTAFRNSTAFFSYQDR
jgi:hypothetical protein